MDTKNIKLEKKLILEEPSDVTVVSKLDDRVDTSEFLDKGVKITLTEDASEPVLDEVEPQEPSEAPAEAKEVDDQKEIFEKSALTNFLNTAIIDEFETVDLYNSYIITIENMLLSVQDEVVEKQYKDVIEILTDIVNEEHIHVGQLQKALSLFSFSVDFIKEGEQEAEEVINNVDEK